MPRAPSRRFATADTLRSISVSYLLSFLSTDTTGVTRYPDGLVSSGKPWRCDACRDRRSYVVNQIAWSA